MGAVAHKTALVTGATAGIGAAIAARLARDGWALALNGLGDADVIDDQIARLRNEHGVDVRFFPGDLSDETTTITLAKTVEDALGGVGLLVNNAGVLNSQPDAVEDVDLNKWTLNLAVNVTAPFLLIRALLPGMRARGEGRIVNIASACGLIALPNSAPYVASKHACVGLTKAVALETAETAITCNAICPALVATPFMADRIASAAERRQETVQDMTRRALRGRQPSGRLVQPEEVAALVTFLAGPEGGSFNGAALPIDQAWTAM
jgi:3-hydroxybutyrate dehydrogenase